MGLRELMGSYAEEAERCIRCGFCNSVCPTTLIEDGYAPSRTSRGRLVLLQSSLQLGRPDPFSESFKDLIDLCFGCMRCVPVCPAGIPIPRVMSSYRAAYVAVRGKRALSRGERALALHYKYAPLLAGHPRLAKQVLKWRVSRAIMEWFLGIAREAPLPVPEGGTLDEYFSKNPSKAYTKEYVYFADTYARYFKPSIGIAARRLLNSLGAELIFTEQYDSGITMLEYGLLDEAKELARRNVESLSRHVELGRAILCTSPAATLMLRQEYPTLLSGERTRVVSESVIDVNELLHEEASKGRLSAKLTYDSFVLHSSCFSRALRLTPLIKETLETLGASVKAFRDECCGVAGSWGLLRRNRARSLEVGAKLFKNLKGPVITNSETCALQIEAATGERALQPLENIQIY